MSESKAYGQDVDISAANSEGKTYEDYYEVLDSSWKTEAIPWIEISANVFDFRADTTTYNDASVIEAVSLLDDI